MKRLLPMLLTLSLILALFCGCTGSNEPVSTPAPTQSGTSAPASDAPSATPEPEQPDDGTLNPDGSFKLPIVSEPMTYTIWNGPYSVESGMEGPNDSLAYKTAEELTNIHIEWETPPSAQLAESFNLMMASQIYLDAFIADPSYFIGGFDKYIEDETIIDLKPLVELYAPNYQALRMGDETVRRYTTTDAGYVPYFRTVSTSREPTWIGYVARQDKLEKAGYTLHANDVETYDQFHDMLVSLKDGASVAPLFLLSGASGMEEALMTGYGVISSFFNKDGKVTYGPADEGYLQYLTMMNSWYNEGLISREFYTFGGFADVITSFATEQYLAGQNLYTLIDTTDMMTPDAESNLQGVKAPVLNSGDIRNMAYMGVPHTVMGGSCLEISTNREDVIPLVKYMDYFYSAEGSRLMDWGVEGVSYIINDDGKPEWMEIVYRNPDGLSAANAQALYSGYSGYHPRLYDWSRGWTPDMSERATTVGFVWDENYVDSQTMPEVMISVEESAEYAAIMTDISTYVSECAVNFITGAKPLTEWDAYLTQLDNMNIAEATAIKQAALERYYAR